MVECLFTNEFRCSHLQKASFPKLEWIEFNFSHIIFVYYYYQQTFLSLLLLLSSSSISLSIFTIIIIELTHSKTILKNTVEIKPQPVALDLKNLSQYSSRSK